MYKIINYCKLCDTKFLHKPRLVLYRRSLVHSEIGNDNLTLDPGYLPHKVERIIDKDNFLISDNKTVSKENFTLVLPPPNITGTLHLGHALTAAIQDVLVKWKRMSGFHTMWVPGIDHAGIATQVIVERRLWKEKCLTRHNMGREGFEKEVWKWKQEKADTINEQLKKLNVSLNWENEVFTMDTQRSSAVQTAFITLFEKGLIYRADQLVNWSCMLMSAISDIEVEHLNINGPMDINVPHYDQPIRFGLLYKFAYKFSNSDNLDVYTLFNETIRKCKLQIATESHQEIVVATTRPETILGDVAVAVNPKDNRYSNLIGQKLWHPFRNEVIPIIADEYVDPSFGTGALKITPAHDLNDFEIGKKHSLNILQVIDEKGQLTDICNREFIGIKRFDARKVILDRLKALNLFRGTQEHPMVIPVCSRSKDVIELLIRPQWFVKCDEMAQKALDDVRNGSLIIEPKHFEKVWFDWLENIRDWCISRQLWWGHRIPAFVCHRKSDPHEKVWVAAADKHSALIKAGWKFFGENSKNVNELAEEIVACQDDDVLDTWFSSALQPISAFGWPNKTDELKKYYPLSLMETGHDILFFWVARMVMLGRELTGRLPFDKVLLHGIICDAHGRKMSKTLGNVVAPEDVIYGCSLENLESNLESSLKSGLFSLDEYKKALEGQRRLFPNGIPECGADALRFTLLSHNIKSHFINFDINECYTNKLFCNKIWQATKYTIMSFNNVPEKIKTLDNVNLEDLSLMDRWILSKLSTMVAKVNTSLTSYDFHVATASLKDFLYYEFCDIYLETTKRGLKSADECRTTASGHVRTLLICLEVSLRALTPFMPCLAQHLYKYLPLDMEKKILEFPTESNMNWTDERLEKQVETVMAVVTCIRRLKKMYNVTAKYKPDVSILIKNNESFLWEYTDIIRDLSRLHKFSIKSSEQPKMLEDPFTNKCVKDRAGNTEVFLFVPEELMTALNLDLQKMHKKKSKILKDLEKMKKMVTGSTYCVNVPSETQEIHSKKIASLQEQLDRITNIENLTENRTNISH